MDKLFEAIDRYYEDENEIALYNNIINTDINYKEMVSALEDTLGNKFNEDTFINIITDQVIKDTRSNGYRPATDEDFE